MKKIFLVALIGLVSTGCDKKKGCTEKQALNYDVLAEQNSGCSYSTVTFYGSLTAYNGIPISKVNLTVNGSNIGLISAYYPFGPGNCSAPGTLAYTFNSGKSVDWNAEIILTNGFTVLSSGTVAPTSSAECIKVNVTR